MVNTWCIGEHLVIGKFLGICKRGIGWARLDIRKDLAAAFELNRIVSYACKAAGVPLLVYL